MDVRRQSKAPAIALWTRWLSEREEARSISRVIDQPSNKCELLQLHSSILIGRSILLHNFFFFLNLQNHLGICPDWNINNVTSNAFPAFSSSTNTCAIPYTVRSCCCRMTCQSATTRTSSILSPSISRLIRLWSLLPEVCLCCWLDFFYFNLLFMAKLIVEIDRLLQSKNYTFFNKQVMISNR